MCTSYNNYLSTARRRGKTDRNGLENNTKLNIVLSWKIKNKILKKKVVTFFFRVNVLRYTRESYCLIEIIRYPRPGHDIRPINRLGLSAGYYHR